MLAGTKLTTEPASSAGKSASASGPTRGGGGRLKAKNHWHPQASFSGCKAYLKNLHETKNVSEKELVGRNTSDITEVFTKQRRIQTKTSCTLLEHIKAPK